MKYIKNIGHDVYFNLALEEYIFSHFRNDTYLLLWENERSVIVGKNQNVFEEINIRAAEEAGIRVARRNTGGGTVFHDQGNLNYSFITDYDPKRFTDYDKFIEPVISALKLLGIHAEKRKSSDIAIDGKKISGNAQTTRGGRVLHHGTLLFDTDLSLLENLLKPTEGKITSKSVKSQRSDVTNIKEHMEDKSMTMDDFKSRLLSSFFPEGIQELVLSEEHINGIKVLVRDKYSQWQWNYAKSPGFTFEKESKLSGESIYIKLVVEKGIIQTCEIQTDKPALKELETAVKGCPYSYKEILKNINSEELTTCFF